jgi:DNA-binding transcriptional MerR regulator
MRISDLSKHSGIPVPTIKFYLRERLLQPGTPTARNQAEYGEQHLERLRLIRIFTDIGGANLASVRAVLDAIADPHLPLHDLCRVVHRALYTHQPFAPNAGELSEARQCIDEYIDKLDWHVDADAPGREALAAIMAALRRFGWDCDASIFAPYAEAADHLAAHELDFISPEASRSTAAATVVIGTVLFESALITMRRLAQEHHSAIRFSGPVARPPGPQ